MWCVGSSTVPVLSMFVRRRKRKKNVPHYWHSAHRGVDFVFSFSFGIQVKTRLGQTKLYPKILPPCFVLVLCEVCDTERGANTILTLSCLRQSLKTSLFCAFLTIVSACIQNQPLTQGRSGGFPLFLVDFLFLQVVIPSQAKLHFLKSSTHLSHYISHHTKLWYPSLTMTKEKKLNKKEKRRKKKKKRKKKKRQQRLTVEGSRHIEF